MYGSLEKDNSLASLARISSISGGHLQTFGATQVPPCSQLQIALNKKTFYYNKTLQNIYYFQFQLLFHFIPFHARRHFKAQIVVIDK